MISGSCYPLYSIGNYATSGGTEAAYYELNNLMPVVRDYHLHPYLAYTQLQQMRQTGQDIISLLIWYVHADGSKMGPMVDSGNGPDVQLLNNITHLCVAIRDLGFEELHVRFADQGPNSPINWTAWEESLYQENKKFIWTVRSVVEAALRHSTVSRWYDLGGDRGGDVRGLNMEYMKRMWAEYIEANGNHDSFGFEIEPLQKAIATQIKDVYGTNTPAQWGLQMYDGAPWSTGDLFTWAAAELTATGEIAKPITVLETWYNDVDNYEDLESWAAVLRLNLRAIVQWPLQRMNPHLQFDMNFAACNSAYK